MAYQVQMTKVDENGNEIEIYPKNRKKDVFVGIFDAAIDVKLPGENADETLETSLQLIKAYLKKLKTSAYVDVASSITNDVKTVPSTKLLFDVNKIAVNALPKAGGTMDKDSSIIIPSTEDDRSMKYSGGGVNYTTPTNGTYAAGLGYYDQSNARIGGIGLYGATGVSKYYYIGNYSDPLVKVDMEGNTSIKKKLTVSGEIIGTLNGNSATATCLTNSYTYNTRPTSADDFNTFNKMGIMFSSSSMTTNKPSSDGAIIQIGWDNTSSPFNSVRQQLFLPHDASGNMQYRGWQGSGTTGAWWAWRTLLDSNNYSKYALPLAGGTMSGYITFANKYDGSTYTTGLIFKGTSGSPSSLSEDEYCIKAMRWTNSGSGGTIYGALGTSTLVPLDVLRDTLGYSGRSWSAAYINTLNVSTISGFSLRGHIIPSSTKTYNIGSTDYILDNVYASKLNKINTITFNTCYYINNGNPRYTETYITSGGVQIPNSINTTPSILISSICPYDAYDTLGKAGSYWYRAFIKYLDVEYVDCDLYPSPGLSARLGEPKNKWSSVYSEKLYVDEVHSDLIPAHSPYWNSDGELIEYNLGSLSEYWSKLYVKTTWVYTSILSVYQGLGYIGSTTNAFEHSVMTIGYRFTDGDNWYNGISYASSISVHYSSSPVTTFDNGIIIGESGIVCKNISTYVDFTGSGVASSAGFSTYSDPKIKKFTDDIDIDSTKICELFDLIKVRSYKYRRNLNTVEIGINAEEFENSMVQLGLDPEKYGICTIFYKHFVSRGDEPEDDKFYQKFAVISYEKLTTLAIKKIQNMEQTHLEKLNEIEAQNKSLEERLSIIESKLG